MEGTVKFWVLPKRETRSLPEPLFSLVRLDRGKGKRRAYSEGWALAENLLKYMDKSSVEGFEEYMRRFLTIKERES